MPQRASTLRDALNVLEYKPLEFLQGSERDVASNPSFYVDLPPLDEEGDGISIPRPADRMRDQILGERLNAKLFLSGHIGSGKSTQINKLAANEGLRSAFSVVLLRIEEAHQAFLDTPQLLFLMASAIFDFGSRRGLLTENAKWKGILRELSTRLYGEAGLVIQEGALNAEWNLLFIKVRQDLKFSELRRRQLRGVDESNQTLLVDLLTALTLDVEGSGVARGERRSLLLLIDDLDRVHGRDQQEDLFNKNIGLLLDLPFRALYTVPMGAVFGPKLSEVRRALDRLYPLRVLNQSPNSFDPENAFIPGSDAIFRKVLDQRVEPSLFEEPAVRLAAIYSGGVLGEFFRLLQSATQIANYNKLNVVKERALRAAIRDERRRETMDLYSPDYAALRRIHTSLELAKNEERRYLDESRVLERYNDRIWYEVNPILWKVLHNDRAS